MRDERQPCMPNGGLIPPDVTARETAEARRRVRLKRALRRRGINIPWDTPTATLWALVKELR